MVEPQLTTRKESRDWDNREHRRVSPEQRAQGNPARPGALPIHSEGLRPEGDQLARKEAIQNLVISPESPGEDPYIPDQERVKSSSSAGSGRRSNFRGSPRRVKEVRSDSAKRKTPEAAGACRSYGARSEGAKKRSKQNSPGKQDQERSTRY